MSLYIKLVIELKDGRRLVSPEWDRQGAVAATIEDAIHEWVAQDVDVPFTNHDLYQGYTFEDENLSPFYDNYFKAEFVRFEVKYFDHNDNDHWFDVCDRDSLIRFYELINDDTVFIKSTRAEGIPSWSNHTWDLEANMPVFGDNQPIPKHDLAILARSFELHLEQKLVFGVQTKNIKSITVTYS